MVKTPRDAKSRKAKPIRKPAAASHEAREAALAAALPASRTQFQMLLAAITGARKE